MRSLLFVLPLSVGLFACGEDEPKQDTAPPEDTAPVDDGIVHYDEDVQPILDSRCIHCHRGAQAQADVDFSSYDTVMASGVVVPFDSAASALVTIGSHHGSGWFTDDQLAVLVEWIDAGAENL
jgi:hypothetical protein